MKHQVTVRYCPKCHWLPRATWVAQEILQTFSELLEGVLLSPADAGTFEVLLGGEKIYDRRTSAGPLDPILLKRSIRDRIAPNMSLGHSDPSTKTESSL